MAYIPEQYECDRCGEFVLVSIARTEGWVNNFSLVWGGRKYEELCRPCRLAMGVSLLHR